MKLIFEPRDFWVGVFFGKDATYITIIPCIVFKFPKGQKKMGKPEDRARTAEFEANKRKPTLYEQDKAERAKRLMNRLYLDPDGAQKVDDKGRPVIEDD